jgi:hypothetical protein
MGLRIPPDRLRRPAAMELLETRGVPAVWRRSAAEALALIELLDERIAPLDREPGPLARADGRVCLLSTNPRHRSRARADDRRRDRRHRPLP